MKTVATKMRPATDPMTAPTMVPVSPPKGGPPPVIALGAAPISDELGAPDVVSCEVDAEIGVVEDAVLVPAVVPG